MGSQPAERFPQRDDPLGRYPLLDALRGRRSRRFGRGMEILEGPFAYRSRLTPLPLTEDEEAALAALRTVRQYGAAVVCPYHWDDHGGENEVGYTIRGTPFERALRRFVEQPDP